MEGLPKNENAYQEDPDLSPEENEYLRDYFQAHPKKTLEKKTDFQKEVTQLETLLSEFEKEFSIEYLNTITEPSEDLIKAFPLTFDVDTPPEEVQAIVSRLTLKERNMYDIRSRAKDSLISTENFLKYLREETTISDEEYNRLNAEYKKHSRAVGILNGNEIRHNL